LKRPRALVGYLTLIVLGGAIGLVLYGEIDKIRGEQTLSWANPWALVLASGCLLALWTGFHLRTTRAASFAFSRVRDLYPTKRGLVARFATLPAVLRIVALGLIAVGLARPQTYKTEILKVEGIDIMIVLDLSKSMEEQDLRRNRLDAGQRTIRNFIDKREADRIGLVVFAREAMLQCPLTLDYASLDQIVADLAIGDVPEMGTAIGDALGLALASLRRSAARSKVVILVSDGDSNVATEMDPIEAKELAVAMGVRVFTILMGQETGRLPFGRSHYAVNPDLLKEIAADSGGLYFNAGDDEALSRSFEQIRKTLEKTKLTVIGTSPDEELFPYFVIPALFLLLLEIMLALTRWRRFP